MVKNVNMQAYAFIHKHIYVTVNGGIAGLGINY